MGFLSPMISRPKNLQTVTHMLSSREDAMTREKGPIIELKWCYTKPSETLDTELRHHLGKQFNSMFMFIEQVLIIYKATGIGLW